MQELKMGQTQDNTKLAWLRPCTSNTPRCHCNVMLKVNLLCVIDHPYNHPSLDIVYHISSYNLLNLHITILDSTQEPSRGKSQNTNCNKRMERSPNHCLSCRSQNHHIYYVNEKFENQTRVPHHKNQKHIQTNDEHNIHTIATLYTSPQKDIRKLSIIANLHDPPKFYNPTTNSPPPHTHTHPIAKPHKNKKIGSGTNHFQFNQQLLKDIPLAYTHFFAYIHNEQYEVTPHPYPLECIPRIEPDQIQGTILISNQYEANDMVPIVSHKVQFTSYSLMSICPWTKIHPQTIGHY